MPLDASLTFLGAAEQVTGSCYLLKLQDKQILLDCGMTQGENQITEWNKFRFAFRPKDIDYVILSHAHIDHSGLIPKLVADGFKGDIICKNADIEGTFEGKIQVQEILNVKSKSHIIGEVICGKLSVEPGAEFSATCVMKPHVKNLPTNGQSSEEKSA